VARVWGSITSTENVVRWCTKNVSKAKKPIETAYRDWKDAVRAADCRDRRAHRSSHEFQWGVQRRGVGARKADVLKRGAARYDAELASAPQAEAKRECELLPGYFTTPSFDLEVHFAQELALIRARPARQVIRVYSCGTQELIDIEEGGAGPKSRSARGNRSPTECRRCKFSPVLHR
jgi:hypothetical protein